MVNLEVLNPQAELSRQDVSIAPRLSELSGKTIGLYWDNKPSGNIVNNFTAELLANKFKNISFKEYVGSVGMASKNATADELDMMAKECDAIIGAIGD